MKEALSRHINNMRMRTKLSISFLLIVLIPFISFVIIIFRYSGEVEKQALNSSLQLYGQTMAYVDYKVNLILNTINQIVLSSEVRDVLSQSSLKYTDDITLWDEDKTRLDKIVFNLRSQQVLSNVIFYMTDSLAGVNESNNVKLLKNYENTTWYPLLKSGNMQYVWLPSNRFEDSLDKTSITLLRKIPSSNNLLEMVSIVRMDIPLSVFSDAMKKSVTSDNGLAAIVNKKDEIVYSTGADLKTDPATILRLIEKNSSPDLQKSYSQIEFNQKKLVVFSQAIEKTDWKLLLVISYDSILLPGMKFRNRMLLVFFATALLIIPLIYIIAFSNTKRIKKLISNMKKISQDDFNILLLPQSRDEIGELTSNFNYMLSKISILLDEKYKLGKEKKNLELKALQAQINPHFLYNTLDMLNLMSLENNDLEVNSAVHELSNFYKLSLSKGQDIVTLQNEIDHIKSYVNIQNMRYCNCIELKINITPELMQYHILKIILQPIVENAFLHGILEKDSQNGEIAISAELCSQDLIITVFDDGVGILPEKLEGLLSGGLNSNLHGYGVKNINERLKLNYGSQYGLTYLSKHGLGTSVLIRIPAVSNEPDEIKL